MKSIIFISMLLALAVMAQEQENDIVEEVEESIVPVENPTTTTPCPPSETPATDPTVANPPDSQFNPYNLPSPFPNPLYQYLQQFQQYPFYQPYPQNQQSQYPQYQNPENADYQQYQEQMYQQYLQFLQYQQQYPQIIQQFYPELNSHYETSPPVKA